MLSVTSARLVSELDETVQSENRVSSEVLTAMSSRISFFLCVSVRRWRVADVSKERVAFVFWVPWFMKIKAK